MIFNESEIFTMFSCVNVQLDPKMNWAVKNRNILNNSCIWMSLVIDHKFRASMQWELTYLK